MMLNKNVRPCVELYDCLIECETLIVVLRIVRMTATNFSINLVSRELHCLGRTGIFCTYTCDSWSAFESFGTAPLSLRGSRGDLTQSLLMQKFLFPPRYCRGSLSKMLEGPWNLSDACPLVIQNICGEIIYQTDRLSVITWSLIICGRGGEPGAILPTSCAYAWLSAGVSKSLKAACVGEKRNFLLLSFTLGRIYLVHLSSEHNLYCLPMPVRWKERLPFPKHVKSGRIRSFECCDLHRENRTKPNKHSQDLFISWQKFHGNRKSFCEFSHTGVHCFASLRSLAAWSLSFRSIDVLCPIRANLVQLAHWRNCSLKNIAKF